MITLQNLFDLFLSRGKVIYKVDKRSTLAALRIHAKDKALGKALEAFFGGTYYSGTWQVTGKSADLLARLVLEHCEEKLDFTLRTKLELFLEGRALIDAIGRGRGHVVPPEQLDLRRKISKAIELLDL